MTEQLHPYTTPGTAPVPAPRVGPGTARAHSAPAADEGAW